MSSTLNSLNYHQPVFHFVSSMSSIKNGTTASAAALSPSYCIERGLLALGCFDRLDCIDIVFTGLGVRLCGSFGRC
jgi:hypothetical protein